MADVRYPRMRQMRWEPKTEAALAQGYMYPVERQACQNCGKAETIKKRQGKNYHCTKGDFPVSPFGLCTQWSIKK